MLLEIGLHFFIPKGFIHPLVAIVADIVLVLTGGVIQYGPVSYTHLTLPTN